MKISSRVEGSVCGALLARTRQPAVRLSTPTYANANFFTDAAPRVPADNGRRKPSPRTATKSEHCPRSITWLQSTFATAFTRPTKRCSTPRRRYGHAAPCPADPNEPRAIPRPTREKEQLMRYLGPGEEAEEVDEALQYHLDPYRRGYAQPTAPTVQIATGEEWRYPSPKETLELDSNEAQTRTQLYASLVKWLRTQQKPDEKTLQDIYDQYMQLPEPRMLYISWTGRVALMRLMGRVRKRSQDAMLRYFALLADIKDACIPVRLVEWNFAIAFASKYVTHKTSQELESALQLWKDMERSTNTRADAMTFNILFDVAIRSGNLNLAEMLLAEMEKREITPNRYHATSLIFFFGLKGDADGVRAAFKETVDRGYLVDTATLNCVISASLRCGDEATATNVYEEMKTNSENGKGMPHRDYESDNVMNGIIDMFSRVISKHPEMRHSFQDNINLAPNIHTYKVLLRHWAERVGDLSTVARFLDEMKVLGIPLHATIFLPLFKGFFAHGGDSAGAWTKQRLDGILQALYEAVDRKERGFKIEKWVITWALRATKKCADNEAVEEVWLELSKRWKISESDEDFLEALKGSILNGSDLMSATGAWTGQGRHRRKKDGSRL